MVLGLQTAIFSLRISYYLSSVCFSAPTLPLWIRTGVLLDQAPLSWPHLHLITSSKNLCLSKVTFKDTMGYDCSISFQGGKIQSRTLTSASHLPEVHYHRRSPVLLYTNLSHTEPEICYSAASSPEHKEQKKVHALVREALNATLIDFNMTLESTFTSL